MTSGRWNGSVWALWALAVTLMPTQARASCIDAAGCLCPTTPQTVAVQAEVQSLSKNGVIVAIDALTLAAGATTTLTVGATTTADLTSNGLVLQPGDRIVGTANASNLVTAVARIEGDQRVTCKWAATFRPLADNARAAMVSVDCKKSLVDLGFKQPPCNDTVAVGFDSCAAGRQPSPNFALALALVLTLVLVRRRQG